jgi:hypothetical protein
MTPYAQKQYTKWRIGVPIKYNGFTLKTQWIKKLRRISKERKNVGIPKTLLDLSKPEAGGNHMHHKSLYSRIRLIAGLIKKENIGPIVIRQYPGESEESLQQREDKVRQENIRQYGQSGMVVIVKNFSDMEVKDDPK